MYSIAFDGNPPLHPESHAFGTSGSHPTSQSSNCCSLSSTSFPSETKCAPSMAPVVENVQQLPHCPWSLTRVTAPLNRQSNSLGKCFVDKFSINRPSFAASRFFARSSLESLTCPKYFSANSSGVRSLNIVTPCVALPRSFACCLAARTRFSPNTTTRRSYSSTVFAAYSASLPNFETNARNSARNRSPSATSASASATNARATPSRAVSSTTAVGNDDADARPSTER